MNTQIAIRPLFTLFLCLFLSCLVSAQEETPTPYEIALQRIEEAQNTDARFLDLAGLGLSEVPPEIGNLVRLQSLDLMRNQLSTLPAEIGNLTSLLTLYVYENQLTSLPPEIGNLRNLIELYANDNLLGSLPPDIGNLSNLCRFYLDNNQLETLPTELGRLSLLANERTTCGLSLQNNPLISPPPEVIAQGTPAVLDYLRNPLLWHIRRYALYWAAATGGIITLLIAVRWRISRAKGKKKKGE